MLQSGWNCQTRENLNYNKNMKEKVSRNKFKIFKYLIRCYHTWEKNVQMGRYGKKWP